MEHVKGKMADYSLLRILFCSITLPAVLLSQSISLSPGPEVYVINGSNLTLWCTTDSSWTVIIFQDYGIRSYGIEVVSFAATNAGCDTTSVLPGYSGLQCYLRQPVGMNIHKVTNSYHNKTISCQVNLGTTPVETVVKIREMLTPPLIEPKNSPTQREGLSFDFTCTAQSIPRAVIEWFLGELKISIDVTTSSPTENTIISKIKIQARKEDNNVDLYCRANNSFTVFPSSSVNLNVLYVPRIYIEPNYTTYVVYEGQKDVSMTCKVASANPSNIIQYQWLNRGGIVNNEKVNIAVISKADGGSYACNASNTVGTSIYATCRVDVQYGPILAVLPEKNITAGNDLSVMASVDSNPSSSAVWWTRLNDPKFMHVGLTLKIPTITKQDSDNYTCHARNTLMPSGMLKQNRTTEKTVYVNVQYVPTINMTPAYDPYVLYSGQSRVLLTCIVEDANPSTSITYQWMNPAGIAEGQTYMIQTVSNTDSGYYRCLARNSIGNSSIYTKQIEVHYGPIIAVIPGKNITAGSQLSVSPSIDANPKSFVVWWTRQNDTDFNRNGPTLILRNIQKQDSDNYICHVRNTLMPSGLPIKERASETMFSVNVQYVPTIIMKPAYDPYVIYSGQNNVSLTCIVESANPLNGITYHWTHPAGNAEGQTYPIERVSNTASGQYRCYARNSIGNSSVYTKQIDVHYGPLISNISNHKDIVEGKNLMIYPVVDSNPAARFVWWTRQKDSLFRFDSSVLIINRIHRNLTDNYTFRVINTLSPSGMDARNSTSDRTLYVNVQYPPSSIIADDPYRQILENTNVTLHCSAKDANPSTTSISWYQHETSILSNTANYTISNINRTAAGSYICNAGNKVGNGTSSVNITVLYGPDVINLSVINGSTVRDNSTAVIECEIDSNPVSSIEWTFNNEPISDYDYNERQRFYYIRKTTCYHTGKYRCSATNTIYEQVYNASKDIHLYVTCSPRLNIYKEQPEAKIGLPLGGILNLNVHIVAFPYLTKKEWTFRSNISSNISFNQEGKFESNGFRHIASLYKPNMTENDFGDYTLEVHNDVGSNKYNFHVVPEGPPEPSLITNATCGIRTALVYWVTSFSGGDTQNFSVIIDNGNWIDTIETNRFSNAKGEIQNTSLHLSPSSYTFTILGKNQYDSAISSNMMSCHVTDAPNTGTSSVVAAAAGGGIGTAVIILGAVVLILLIVKRRRALKGKERENGRKKLTEEDNDDEGLKDNPLYGTSSACNDESGPMYSHVKKSYKIEDHQEDAVDIGAVYSQVQKKASKGNIVKNGKGKKREKQFGRNQKDIEMGSVYENSDKVMKEKQTDEIYANTGIDTKAEQPIDKCGSQQIKNKDGLIYADLDLAPSGKRFVIRGIENRNNYAIIDLTKTAEPLPSDEEDDEEPNGLGNTSTNLE